MRAWVILVLALALAACGGGGGSDSGDGAGTRDDGNAASGDRPLPFPFRAVSNQHYSTSELPDIHAADVRHMPIYHDGSYHQTGGYPSGSQARNRRVFVGIDQGEAVRALPKTGTRGALEVRHGRLNDGAGRQAVVEYMTDAGQRGRFSEAPEVRLIGPANTRDHQIVAAAVQVVNAALPDGFKMSLEPSLPGFSLRDTVNAGGYYFTSGRERGNTIHVEFVPPGEFYDSGAGATTWNNFSGDTIESSYIQLAKGAYVYQDSTDRRSVILLAHEFLHSLGFYGLDHVSPSFDTILEGGGAIYSTHQGEQQPLSILYPVDREALRAYYGLRDPASPGSLGPWASTSLHVHGNGPHAGFGVALRNGYAEPWAYGRLPSGDIRNNRSLPASATWNGALLGLTPSAEAVAGDASITVNTGTLTGRADFTDLEKWAPSQAPGAAGTGSTWGDGDLGYSLSVRGNTFRETGGDAGRLTGVFTGPRHEGAAGTLERSDLTAAFGAAR